MPGPQAHQGGTPEDGMATCGEGRLIVNNPGTPELNVEKLDRKYKKLAAKFKEIPTLTLAERLQWHLDLAEAAYQALMASLSIPQPASGPSAAGGSSAGGSPPPPPRPSKL